MKKSTRWTTLFDTKGTTKETYCSSFAGKGTQWKTTHGNPQVTSNMLKRWLRSIKRSMTWLENLSNRVIPLSYPTTTHIFPPKPVHHGRPHSKTLVSFIRTHRRQRSPPTFATTAKTSTLRASRHRPPHPTPTEGQVCRRHEDTLAALKYYSRHLQVRQRQLERLRQIRRRLK